MKKVFSIIICIVVLLCGSVTAYAKSPHIIDDAGLLSAQEALELEKTADSISSTYGMDVLILTTYSLDGKTAQAYADDYYDENNRGTGNNSSGILLLIAMEAREWHISTCGEGIYAFTDYGIERLADDMLYFLSDGAFYDAFTVYLELLPDYFEAYHAGTPIDGYTDSYYPNGGLSEDDIEHVYYPSHGEPADSGYGRVILYSLVIGIVAAAAALYFMRRAMNTARPQRDAGSYVKDGSYQLNSQRDIFLYSRVTRIKRPENNNSSGRSGGSSVHRSSGGVRHGGRGGKF